MLKRLVNFATLFIFFPYLKSMIFIKEHVHRSCYQNVLAHKKSNNYSPYLILRVPEAQNFIFSSCPVRVLTARKACEVSDFSRYRWASRSWLLNFRRPRKPFLYTFLLAHTDRLVVLNQFMCVYPGSDQGSNNSWFWTDLCVPQQRSGV